MRYDPALRKYVIKYAVAGHEVISYMPANASKKQLDDWESYHKASCRKLVLQKILEDEPQTTSAI